MQLPPSVRKIHFRGFYCLIFCFLTLPLSAQDGEITLTLSVQNSSPEEVIDLIEEQTQIKIWLTAESLPQYKKSFQFDQTPLTEAMSQILQGSNLAYLQYRNYLGIIAPRSQLDKEYSANYYETLNQSLLLSNDSSTQIESITVLGSLEEQLPDGSSGFSLLLRDEESQKVINSARLTLIDQEEKINLKADDNGIIKGTVNTGRQDWLIESTGYEPVILELLVYSQDIIELSLSPKIYTLDEVVFLAENTSADLESPEMSIAKVDINSLKKIPQLLGEVDIVKGLLLEPGISSTGEAASGFNVRGGTTDQNLILQDGAMLFNATHALGFFSSFNADLIREASLYKSIIPARFGGRLSSVLDVKTKQGDYQKWGLNGGLGLLSTRLAADGPLIKDKSSLTIGLRASYSDWVLGLVNVPEVQNSSVQFYDANAKYAHRLGESWLLQLSAYRAFDDVNFADQFGFEYETTSFTFGLQSRSDNIFQKTDISFSDYKNALEDLGIDNAAVFETGIQNISLDHHWEIDLNESLQLSTGLMAVLYEVSPGEISPLGEESSIRARSLDTERGLETALFLQTEWTPIESISLSAGIRLNHYRYLGPGKVWIYGDSSFPLEVGQIIDSVTYGDFATITDYTYPEPRFSVNYRFNAQHAIKAGYARTSQYLNQISLLDAPTPNNIWQLSSDYIEPSRSHNLALGYLYKAENQQWELVSEAYYRILDQIYEYRDFAELQANEFIETEVLPGEGRAYGWELGIKKLKGDLTGRLSYTYSRAERQVNGINSGAWYPANFDKTHDLSVIMRWAINRRQSIDINFTYFTGRPTTIPISSYTTINNFPIPYYTERNNERIPDFHRLDIAYTLGRGYRKNRKFDISWTFAVYNVYGRNNAYSVYYVQRPFQAPRAFQLSILGAAFPSLTLNISTL